MKKPKSNLIELICLIFVLISCVGVCQWKQNGTMIMPETSTGEGTTNAEGHPLEIVDYAAMVSLDMDSSFARQEATVKHFIDGDTVYFHVPTGVNETGVLKARLLAVNTPESTAKIEEYGKKAAEFTKERLSEATSILLESENEHWNKDSTGERYLVWVWYKRPEDSTYRNLNVELLQQGLAAANVSADNRYGSACLAAIAQAQAQKLHIYSGEKDPDFYYGPTIEVTLRELCADIEAFEGLTVAIRGVVTREGSHSVYVASYDAQKETYYGITVYYGYDLNREEKQMLAIGNQVRVEGTVQYYEAGKTYQISNVRNVLLESQNP